LRLILAKLLLASDVAACPCYLVLALFSGSAYMSAIQENFGILSAVLGAYFVFAMVVGSRAMKRHSEKVCL